MPPIRTNRTTCREIPRGSETRFSFGHCASGVDHGNMSRSLGSGPVANCMRTPVSLTQAIAGRPGNRATMLGIPSIAELDVPVSPRDDPLSYPGAVPPGSYLWLDAWLYELTVQPGIELGDSRLLVDGGPLRGVAGPLGGPADRLDAALRTAGVAQVPQRYPVLAYGSQAAPAPLLDKFSAPASPGRVGPGGIARVTG